MAQLVTLIIASRSCSILGSGTLSQQMSVVPCQTSAFTATSAVIHSVGFININPARSFQSGIIAIRQNGETHHPVRGNARPSPCPSILRDCGCRQSQIMASCQGED